MKLIAMLGAGALAAGSLVAIATPAEAQRHGYRGYHGGYRGHHYAPRHYGGYRGHYRPRYAYGYGRGRVGCRIHRGYYGPVRRCR